MLPAVCILPVRDCYHFKDELFRGIIADFLTISDNGELFYDESLGQYSKYPELVYVGKVMCRQYEDFINSIERYSRYNIRIGKISGKFDISKFSFTILIEEKKQLSDDDLYLFYYEHVCSIWEKYNINNYVDFYRLCYPDFPQLINVSEFFRFEVPKSLSELLTCPSVVARVSLGTDISEAKNVFKFDYIDMCVDMGYGIQYKELGQCVYAIMNMTQYKYSCEFPEYRPLMGPCITEAVEIPIGTHDDQLYNFTIRFSEVENRILSPWSDRMLSLDITRRDLRTEVGKGHKPLGGTHAYGPRPRYGLASRFFGFLD